MNYDAYKKRDLQHFMQMLSQCEAKGITDIRFVREALHRYLYRPQKVRPSRPVKIDRKEHRCPECGSIMYPAKGERPGTFVLVDGRKVLVCAKCRYSEVGS